MHSSALPPLHFMLTLVASTSPSRCSCCSILPTTTGGLYCAAVAPAA